jgi:hypothetical protein
VAVEVATAVGNLIAAMIAVETGIVVVQSVEAAATAAASTMMVGKTPFSI